MRVDVPLRVVLQQRVVIILVLRGAVPRRVTGIRRWVGWRDGVVGRKVVGIAEGMIIVIARHEMRNGVRFISVNQSRLAQVLIRCLARRRSPLPIRKPLQLRGRRWMVYRFRM